MLAPCSRLSGGILILLFSLPLFAREIVGGLPRAASLGAALRPSDGNVAIEAVGPGSSAEKMGLQRDDVVVSVDGSPIADPAALVAAITKKRGGDAVTIVVRRGDQTLTKDGTLNAAPFEKQAAYDIEYGSVDKRRTIVTRPRGEGKHPPVLLIGGIGCYSLDGLLRPAEPRDPYAKLLDAT